MKKDRNYKTKMLHEIMQGRKQLQDLIPAKYILKIAHSGNPAKAYKNGKEISSEEWSEHINQSAKPLNVKVKIAL